MESFAFVMTVFRGHPLTSRHTGAWVLGCLHATHGDFVVVTPFSEVFWVSSFL